MRARVLFAEEPTPYAAAVMWRFGMGVADSAYLTAEARARVEIDRLLADAPYRAIARVRALNRGEVEHYADS